MSYFEAAILGIIQGLTEYLPVSSSGHLVLAQELLGTSPQGISFEVLVHLGSLLAVIIYFRLRLFRMAKSLFVRDETTARLELGYLIVGTIPAAVIGLSFEGFFERVFSEPIATSALLMVTGVILLSTKLVKKESNSVSWLSALLIGIAQAFAILPGISRSGSTISAGIWARVDPAKAAEFSFLLSIPAIGGAVILKSGELFSGQNIPVGPYLAAFIMSFVFSLAAIHWLLGFIKKGRFELFAYYCFAAGALGLYLFSK